MDVVFIKGFPTSIFKKFDFILSEISAFINVLDLIIFLTFNKLLSEVNKKGTIHAQIDYNDYNRLNDLLNIQLENWEKNQIEINKITKS